MLQAVVLVRAAIERMYDDRCAIYQRRAVVDQKSGLTSFVEVLVLEQQRCRLSIESVAVAGGLGAAARGTGVAAAGGTAAAGKAAAAASPVAQKVKLFLPPEVEVTPGSRVVVRGKDYAGSGIPAVYETHQEIVLTALQVWA